MSGFEVLIQLIPVSRKPEIAVVVLTHLSNRAIGEDLEERRGLLLAQEPDLGRWID